MNDTTMLHEGFITTKEASRLFKYTPSYLAHLIRIKKINGHRLGRNWLIEQDSLLRFIEHRGKEDAKSARTSAHPHVPQEHVTHRVSIEPVTLSSIQPSTLTAHQNVSSSSHPRSPKWRTGVFMIILLVLGAITVFGFGIIAVKSPVFSQSIDTLQTLPGSISRIPLGLGEFVIAATHAVIAADVALAYGIAAAAPAIAHVTVQILISIGDNLSNATARIPAQVASVFAYGAQ
jgi:excisionase family DNA binding protein